MRLNSYFTRKRVILLCSVFVTAVLLMQLVAATAWTADAANAGPGVTIVQLSPDSDSDWATNDLLARLNEFIHDDPFFTDRISVIKTSDPYVVESITDRVVIYVSHGGPIGIVTGNRLTSWRTMAEIITESKAIMHLFTSCYSRNIIRYGDGDSGEKLYTVPGARPAEVTNVEITTTVMLALGVDAEEVEQYRISELTAAKEWIEAGEDIHIMDFEQIILDEIETIDETYSDTYTDTHRVYRYAVEDILNDVSEFGELPSDIDDVLRDYFTIYWTGTDLVVLPFYSCYITYIRNYYYEAEWVVDDPIPDPDEPPEPNPDPEPIIDDPPVGPESCSTFYMSAAAATGGHWENGPHLFSGGTYSGMVTFGDYGFINHIVTINITASGPTIDSNGVTEVDSLSLRSIAPMGTYMMNQKVDGVWGEPVVGRDPARTGGLWTDSAVRSDYEYVSNVPSIPYPSSTGILSTNGEYYTITSIPGVGSDWHGPSFIQTLPSYFKLRDFGSFSANLSFIHGPNGLRKGQTCVSLYDENMQIALSLMIADDWDIETGGDKQYFSVIYYNEAGVATTRQSDIFTGDINGIVTVRYDTEIGLHWKAPGESDQIFMTKNNLNVERLIKYVGISSYRYGWRAEHDERIYNIRLSYAASEYTVFHDSCNDMNNFYRNLDFGYGTSANGTFVVPAGESYITLSNVDSGTSWHGPNYVHVLDRPFRLYQLTDFSVAGGIVQGSNQPLGKMYVALFDENMQIAMLVHWGDSWSGDDKGYYYVYFYPQNGGSSNQHITDIQGSFEKTGKLWWDESSGGQGAIYSTIDGSGSGVPISECYNASRVIKYVVLLGYQYSTYPIVDMRIQDINVVADPNKRMAPPPFVDDCSDNDNFPLDNTFPWYTPTYGELSVGSGYLYPSAIPSSPTGWHGPNFVHVLSNPFELQDLSEFSVEGAIDHSTSGMGRIMVALFDENMQIVLRVFWGDAWAYSSKGYFHVTYYPEGGSAVSDSTGYIYTSFDRTGKLWVHNGNVKYDIEGIASGDFGVVANPHRVIKYIAIHCDRYSHYNLGDIRIKNIVVSEGLPTTSAPMYADATSHPPESTTDIIDLDLSQAIAMIAIYWTGWWPLLHFDFEVEVAPDNIPVGHPAKPAEGKFIVASAEKNILGITENQDITINGDGSFGQPSDEILNQNVQILTVIIQTSLNIALIGLEIAANTGNAPATALFVISTVALTFLFFGLIDWFHQKMLEKGSWNHYECFNNWLMIGVGILINIFALGAIGFLLNFISPMSPMQSKAVEWASELTPLRQIAQVGKLAFFYMIAMGIYCILAAMKHLVLSF